MPAVAPVPVVIGLVLTLAAADAASSALLAELRRQPRLRLGEQNSHWLPATAETTDPRELHRWLEAQPGVRAVDVVFVEVTPEAESSSEFVVPPSGSVGIPPDGGTTGRAH